MLRQALLSASLVFAVTTALGTNPVVSVYSGQYFYNFENAYITPQGSAECWAIKGDLSAAEIPGKGGAATWGTADVVVRGTLSPKGRYGNLGACTHQLTVLEIVSISNKVSR